VLPAVHVGNGWLERRQVPLPVLVQFPGDGGVEPDRGRLGQEPKVAQGMVKHVDVAHRWRLGGAMGRRLPDRISNLRERIRPSHPTTAR
jgi:hypothetical protein